MLLPLAYRAVINGYNTVFLEIILLNYMSVVKSEEYVCKHDSFPELFFSKMLFVQTETFWTFLIFVGHVLRTVYSPVPEVNLVPLDISV